QHSPSSKSRETRRRSWISSAHHLWLRSFILIESHSQSPSPNSLNPTSSPTSSSSSMSSNATVQISTWSDSRLIPLSFSATKTWSIMLLGYSMTTTNELEDAGSVRVLNLAVCLHLDEEIRRGKQVLRQFPWDL
ncbi:hypothetical protein LINPERHAP2_LOCUS17141, partial [Linum perenne]